MTWQPSALDPRDARVFDPRVADAALPPAVGREHDALTLDPDGHAVLDHDAGEPDARDVALGHHPRQQVQLRRRGRGPSRD